MAEGTVGSCCFFLFPKRRIYRPDSLEMHLIAKVKLVLRLIWSDGLGTLWACHDCLSMRKKKMSEVEGIAKEAEIVLSEGLV